MKNGSALQYLQLWGWLTQLVGVRDRSLALITTGPALPPAPDIEEYGGGGGHLYSAHSATIPVSNGDSTPMLTISGQAHLHLL